MIKKRIRCMLSHVKLLKPLREGNDVDVINLSPSFPLNHDVPQRVWTGKNVSYYYLRAFDCTVFVHVLRDEGLHLIAR